MCIVLYTKYNLCEIFAKKKVEYVNILALKTDYSINIIRFINEVGLGEIIKL